MDLLRNWHRVAFGACAAWLVFHELRVVLVPDADFGVVAARGVHDAVLVLAAVLCLWRAFTGARRERLAWALLGAGVLSWSFGEVYYTAVLWDESAPPIPSPADVGFLLFAPLALAGILALLRARARGVPRRLWLDGLTAALAVGAASAAIVFETVLEQASGEPMTVAVSLAYPLTDLVLLAVIVGALAGTGWRLDRAWMLLAIGVSTFWLADSLYLVQTARGTYEAGGWFDAGWWAGLLLIAAAAWQREPARDRRPLDESLRLIAVPLGFGLAGLGLLVYGCWAALNPLAIVLAAASLLAVMARAMLTFADNVAMLHMSRDEALTDALTGLGNRRALARELEAILPEVSADEPLVLALFDLDGFKHYNDTFGHPAGDGLLVRLGANLAGFVKGRGRAYRMGGDEFCVLLRPGAANPATIVEGAALALSEYGEGFSVTCSFGSITLPEEASDTHEALRIADQRMYASKHAGRMSAGRQSKDVLLRALSERDPALRAHLSDIADLAEHTAIGLGLAPEDVERVRHAAELHDVGKVAVPDAILAKPGPLDEDEWAFIRRHTLTGERIISAAPALTSVAALVRSSHERWDGTGYPDELAAEAIPIGSRIVAVADAFHAMTAGRPYRPAVTPQIALAELRRCAGTQFDPEVVDAFCDAWTLRNLPAAA
jgi:diguanylate cyclase (GGDEF)-like protein